jgi:hypothetical protein
MSNFAGAEIEVTMEPGTINAINEAILAAVKDVFQGVILADAKANSPLGTEPVEPGSMRNRDSIEAHAFMSHRGPFAKLFTQSGHGGYLELGTRYMGAQPYLWPAFQMNLGTLIAQIKAGIAAIESTGGGAAVSLGRVMPDVRNT